MAKRRVPDLSIVWLAKIEAMTPEELEALREWLKPGRKLTPINSAKYSALKVYDNRERVAREIPKLRRY